MAKQERKVKEFLARLPVGFAPFFKQVKRFTKFLKSKFYKHKVLSFRILYLVIAILLGLGLSYLGISCIPRICPDSIPSCKVIEKLLIPKNWLIITGLPVAFFLWLFRTKDRKEQIQASLLANSLTLLTSGNVGARAVGLVQLLQLRNKEKVYKDQIDIATPGTDLEGAYLLRADLQSAYLQSANLQDAKLQEANLEGANLERANLQKTLLYKADLRNAYLRDAYLHGTILQDANLQDANLQNSYLRDAKLQGARLQRADLRNANLEGANVLDTKFEGAKYNAQTKVPHDNFKPEEHGMKFDPESMK